MNEKKSKDARKPAVKGDNQGKVAKDLPAARNPTGGRGGWDRNHHPIAV
jgi:hypothetical protein